MDEDDWWASLDDGEDPLMPRDPATGYPDPTMEHARDGPGPGRRRRPSLWQRLRGRGRGHEGRE